MSDINLTLTRSKKFGYGILGELTFTLQSENSTRSYKYFTLENDNYKIPEGRFEIKYTYSPRFGRKMPLIDVPGRKGIRIHAANYPWQLRGCVAIGKPLDVDKTCIVERSQEYCDTFNYLMNYYKEPVYVSITSKYSSPE